VATEACLWPGAVAFDAAGNLFIIDTYNHRIRRIGAGTNTISTFAGSGATGFCGDDGPATDACLDDPRSIALDSHGNLLITDDGRVRKVDAVTGKITTVAGGGTATCDQGGPAGSVVIDYLGPLAIDANDNLYVADEGNEIICRIDAATNLTSVVPLEAESLATDAQGNLLVGRRNGQVSRVEHGTGPVSTFLDADPQSCIPEGDPDPGEVARAVVCHGDSTGLAVDGAGDVFVAGDNDVRRVDAVSHAVTTVAGNGTYDVCGEGAVATNACLGIGTYGIAADSHGNVFIDGVDRVWRVDATTDVLKTIAQDGEPCSATPRTASCLAADILSLGVDGTDQLLLGIQTDDDGGPLRMDPVTLAISSLTADREVRFPFDVALDSAGNVLVADLGTVRRVDARTGAVSTVAGSRTSPCGGDGGPATAACMNPGSIAVDRSGNLYVADHDHIRRVDAATGIVDRFAGSATGAFCGDGGPARAACFDRLSAIRLDVAGNVYVADEGNARVRRIDADTGKISTLAGGDLVGWCGDGGPATDACLWTPNALAIDRAGNVLIGDYGSDRVRRVTCAPDTDGDGVCDAYDLSDVDGLVLASEAVGMKGQGRRRHGYVQASAKLSLASYPPAGDAVGFFTLARAKGFRLAVYATDGEPGVFDRPITKLGFTPDECRFTPAKASVPKRVRCVRSTTSLVLTRGRPHTRFTLRLAARGLNLAPPSSGPLHLTFTLGSANALDFEASIGTGSTGGAVSCAPGPGRRGSGIRCALR
jgi:streptogramin lyase